MEIKKKNTDQAKVVTLNLPHIVLRFIIVPKLKNSPLVINVKDHNLCEIKITREKILEDIEQNALYGFISDHILLADNVNELKVLLLKSIVRESLYSLYREYKAMLFEMLIKPSFLIAEHYIRKGNIFFMIKDHYRCLAREALQRIIDSPLLNNVLDELEKEGLIERRGSFIKPSIRLKGEFEEKKTKYMSPLITTLKNVSSFTLLSSAFSIINLLARIAFKVDRSQLPSINEDSSILVETDKGLKPLNPEEELKGIFGRKIVLKKLGGMINTAYLLIQEDGTRRVIKLFNEWTNLKWLPLAFWALGAYTFDPTGKGRLINEYTMNRQFKRMGLKVPSIYSIDLNRKIIVEEYINGKTLKDIIVEILNKNYKPIYLEYIRQALSKISFIHSRNYVLGDANPSNILIHDRSNEVYFIDLEQSREGDKFAWDLSTIMFFLAHYMQGFSFDNLDSIVNSMIEGYLEHGSIKDIEDALRIPYLRVYAFFAYPHAIYKVYRTVSKCLRSFK